MAWENWSWIQGVDMNKPVGYTLDPQPLLFYVVICVIPTKQRKYQIFVSKDEMDNPFSWVSGKGIYGLLCLNSDHGNVHQFSWFELAWKLHWLEIMLVSWDTGSRLLTFENVLPSTFHSFSTLASWGGLALILFIYTHVCVCTSIYFFETTISQCTLTSTLGFPLNNNAPIV